VILPSSQTGQNWCSLYMSVQSVRPRGGPYHDADMAEG
jgi:hypothetical protein